MKSLNEATLVGNLTRDPELRYTPSGTPVVQFGLATNDSQKDKTTGEWKDIPEFHNIVFWSKSAEVISQYCQKGNKLLVKGRIKTRKYTNKAGVDVYTTEIIGRDFILLTPKGGGRSLPPEPGTAVPGETYSAGNKIEDIIIPDDLPQDEIKVPEDMPF